MMMIMMMMMMLMMMIVRNNFLPRFVSLSNLVSCINQPAPLDWIQYHDDDDGGGGDDGDDDDDGGFGDDDDYDELNSPLTCKHYQITT